jgi:hypothetical protein
MEGYSQSIEVPTVDDYCRLRSSAGLTPRSHAAAVKLLVTVPAVVLMLVHVRPVNHLASLVSTILLPNADLARPGLQLLLYGCAAQVVLLVATVLSTYKPRGRTRYAVRA